MFKKTYYRAIRKFLDSKGFQVPDRYLASFVHWGGGADAQYIYRRMLGENPSGKKALIIGVMGGRDYFLFRNLGLEVTAVDLGPQPEITDITHCNVEKKLPFEKHSFDVILIGEVLEHLEQDVEALRNLREVLKDDGTLLVSVPFYNDWEEGHMRIHSPRSIKRLLKMGGFDIEKGIDRPGIVRLVRFNFIQHGLTLLVYKLTGFSMYSVFSRWIGIMEWNLGGMKTIRPVRRLFAKAVYGGYFKCKKGFSLDHVSVNKALYTERNS